MTAAAGRVTVRRPARALCHTGAATECHFHSTERSMQSMDERLLRPENEQELLLLLGLMVREAGHVETRLRFVAGALTLSPHAQLITAGEGVSRLIDMCWYLVDAQPGISLARVDGLRGILSRCRAAFQRRDQYVHGSWAVDGETREWSTMRSRRNRSVPTFAPMSGEDLGQLAKELNDLAGEVTGWLVREEQVNDQ